MRGKLVTADLREPSGLPGRVPRSGTARRVGLPTEPLLRLDPDLGEPLSEERRAAAERELLVRTAHIPVGAWEPARHLGRGPASLGLLLVTGVVAREVRLDDLTSAELLAPGDLVRPVADDHVQTLRPPVRWTALSRTQVAILDAGLLAPLLTRFPEVLLAIMQRVDVRADRLGLTQAISQMTGVDRRLEALFWCLADRWGRVTPDGVLVPLPLSHRLLGTLVGARRPTVSTALAGLAERGRLQRHPGGWLLAGPAPRIRPAEDGFAPHRRPLSEWTDLSATLVA
jgi:CRP/FNR family cyclic AMP-dependent transcriptional regulator